MWQKCHGFIRWSPNRCLKCRKKYPFWWVILTLGESSHHDLALTMSAYKYSRMAVPEIGSCGHRSTSIHRLQCFFYVGPSSVLFINPQRNLLDFHFLGTYMEWQSKRPMDTNQNRFLQMSLFKSNSNNVILFHIPVSVRNYVVHLGWTKQKKMINKSKAATITEYIPQAA